eukprot:g18536.t1
MPKRAALLTVALTGNGVLRGVWGDSEPGFLAMKKEPAPAAEAGEAEVGADGSSACHGGEENEGPNETFLDLEQFVLPSFESDGATGGDATAGRGTSTGGVISGSVIPGGVIPGGMIPGSMITGGMITEGMSPWGMIPGGLKKAKAEAGRLRTTHPDRVPVIVEKAAGSGLPDVEKPKYLVPLTMLFGVLKSIISEGLTEVGLPESDQISLSVSKDPPPKAKNWAPKLRTLMSAVDNQHVAVDGFVHLTYDKAGLFSKLRENC